MALTMVVLYLLTHVLADAYRVVRTIYKLAKVLAWIFGVVQSLLGLGMRDEDDRGYREMASGPEPS
eukprot:5063678-Alexandrium_andersonii.AAC.1